MTTALPFIPQRPPFVLVDHIISCDTEVVCTDFTIPAEHILVKEGVLTDAGLMENIAQTCAARIGYLNQDKPVRIGVIGAINNFKATEHPKVGEIIHTTVTIGSEVFNAIIVHAETRHQDKLIAECDMKVFVVDN